MFLLTMNIGLFLGWVSFKMYLKMKSSFHQFYKYNGRKSTDS